MSFRVNTNRKLNSNLDLAFDLLEDGLFKQIKEDYMFINNESNQVKYKDFEIHEHIVNGQVRYYVHKPEHGYCVENLATFEEAKAAIDQLDGGAYDSRYGTVQA